MVSSVCNQKEFIRSGSSGRNTSQSFKMSLFRKFDSANKRPSSNGNYCSSIFEEVALEGLDGITFDALIIRLGQLKSFQFSFEEGSTKEFLFQVLRQKISRVPKKDYDENTDTIKGNNFCLS